MSDSLRDFLELPYDKLEEMNLSAKAQRLTHIKVEEDGAEESRGRAHVATNTQPSACGEGPRAGRDFAGPID